MREFYKQNRKLRIGIDARFYGSKSKGLGRYTQRLIENLEAIDDFNDYVIFLRKENWDEYEPSRGNFKKALADYRWYTFAEQIFMPFAIKRQKLDLMHFAHFNIPVFYGGRFIVTIHDLILKNFPAPKSATTLNPFLYYLKEKAYNLVISQAVKKSEKIIAVSNFTKNDIVSDFAISAEKIKVVYEGVSGVNLLGGGDDDGIFYKLDLKKPYILYVGNAYPHKNLEKLLEAFRIISLKFGDLRLALVGGMDFFYRILQKKISDIYGDLKDKIIFTDNLSDDNLAEIYKNAELYVFPSLYEGFGLPPLEAMAFGVPVVSSDSTCLPEILGDAAFYFNAVDPKDIADKINSVLSNNNLRVKLVDKGFARVKKFSWRKMAEETRNIYLNVLNHK